ncbi:hypothetical protein SESBI_11596 [Sesbania bispinosa]|nr:hypothetical protein SESBI_11596 [Sesbania bispinosa]
MPHAKRYTAYNINGFKFRTIDRDEGLKTQNNGVFLTSNTLCVASSIDANVQQADLPYYGKLEDIIELNYYGLFKVVLFKCKWADTTRERGFRKDAWQFTSVNFSRCIHTGEREEHDPYIEASQAQLVYYVDDEVNKGWSVVVHMKPRDLYDMGQVIEDDICENMPLTRVLKFKRPKSGVAFSTPTRASQIPIPPLGSTSHAPSHPFAPTQQPHDILPKAKRPKSSAAFSAPTRVSQIPIPPLGSTSHAPTQQPHGPDHSGRVRGLGLGGLHSVAFGSTSMRFSGISCGLSSTYSAECSHMKEEVNSLKTKLAASEESVKILKIAMLSYIQMKEGHIPIELGALLGTSTPSGSQE